MTTLYNCHTDGDQYRITKFDSFGNVESTYLCTIDECECPAGFRPTCRHRHMLPRFIAKEAVNSFWFYDYDRQGWVMNDYQGHGPVYEPESTIATMHTIPDDADVAKEFAKLLHPEPAPSQQETSTFLYTTDEPPMPITHVDLFVDAEPAPTPPEPPLRRRI